VAGDMHRQQATTVEGQVDRHNNGMDALGVTEKNGVSGMEGGMPTTGDGANGDACRREDNILSQEKVNFKRELFLETLSLVRTATDARNGDSRCIQLGNE
jgi:hypothetical protein